MSSTPEDGSAASGKSATKGGGCPFKFGGGSSAPSAPSGGACPYKFGGPSSTGAISAAAGAAGAAGAAAGMAAEPPSGGGPEVLNPRNMMPSLPNSEAPSQKIALSKDREASSIPKCQEQGTWVYPSPQQFYHALLRKDKNPEAESMDAVVKVHNVTNEKTWQAILDWERLHHGVCPTPSLLRFLGRDSDLSLGGWLSNRISYRGRPFDRHDWFVDRCGQKIVRYVIDYYDDPKALDQTMQITVEARPAVDSLGALVDRCRRPLWQVQRMWGAIFGPSGR